MKTLLTTSTTSTAELQGASLPIIFGGVNSMRKYVKFGSG
jgi:hypothetical protein